MYVTNVSTVYIFT